MNAEWLTCCCIHYPIVTILINIGIDHSAESLLLGSLLWFLGTICLLLREPLLSTRVEVPLKNVDNQNRGSLAPRKAGSKVFELRVFQSFMMGKRCKASRSRMKPSSLALEVLVWLIGLKGLDMRTSFSCCSFLKFLLLFLILPF